MVVVVFSWCGWDIALVSRSWFTFGEDGVDDLLIRVLVDVGRVDEQGRRIFEQEGGKWHGVSRRSGEWGLWWKRLDVWDAGAFREGLCFVVVEVWNRAYAGLLVEGVSLLFSTSGYVEFGLVCGAVSGLGSCESATACGFGPASVVGAKGLCWSVQMVQQGSYNPYMQAQVCALSSVVGSLGRGYVFWTVWMCSAVDGPCGGILLAMGLSGGQLAGVFVPVCVTF